MLHVRITSGQICF